MNREIKFRAWNKHGMAYFTFKEVTEFDGTPGRCTWPEPTEIMQYTGLKDKNGKEIYEGDIVERTRFTKENSGQVKSKIVFESGGFKISQTVYLTPEKIHKTNLVVIGNIYQNPELLNSTEIKSSYQHPKL